MLIGGRVRLLIAGVFAFALCLSAPQIYSATLRQQASQQVVAVDDDGSLYLVSDGALHPITPPVIDAAFLAQLPVGDPVGARLPGRVILDGELVQSPTGTLWWIGSGRRQEVRPQPMDDVLRDLPRGEPLDLSGAAERAASQLQNQPTPTPLPSTSTPTPAAVAPSPTATPAVTATTKTSAAATAVTTAHSLIDARKYDDAIALLNQYADSNSADVFGALGDAYLGRTKPEDLRKAIDWFTKAIAIAPDVPHYYRGRAMCYDLLGLKTRRDAIADYQHAIDASNRAAIRPAPGDYAEMAQLTWTLGFAGEIRDLNQFELAANEATVAMGLDNDFTPAYIVRTRVNGSRKIPGGAALDIDKAFHIDPGSTDPQHIAFHALAAYWSAFYAKDADDHWGQYFNESVSYWDKYIAILESDPSKVIVHDENWLAVAVQPEWAYYYRGSARSWQNYKDRDRVLADLAKAMQINPNVPQFYYERGRYYNAIGAPGSARNDLRKYLDLVGDDDDGNKGEALSILRKLPNAL